jgi:hypothetical protein
MADKERKLNPVQNDTPRRGRQPHPRQVILFARALANAASSKRTDK